MRCRFRPQLLPTVVAAVLLVGMIKLGFWQYGKAEQKRELQAAYDARMAEAPVALPESVGSLEDWRYRRIRARGRYEPAYQILLDNQVDDSGAAGYHVITPFRPEGSKTLVLVDRGWIAMGDRRQLPEIAVPAGQVEVTGFAWVPSNKFFELAPPQGSGWQVLWQNMDMPRYYRAVPFAVLPFVIRLDASSQAGGFVRNWAKPAERIETHVGYAWQWWGFSLALVAIWLFVNVKREEA